MSVMQFFYDYECPYCKIGYEYLLEQIVDHPDILVEWRPIESHPLPENHHPHTYLANQCFYAAVELHADMPAFHAAMFQAISIERRDAENPDVLCKILEGIVDAEKLREILSSGKYAKQIEDNNHLAYDESDVWYVPAFRLNGNKLDAKGGIGIRPEELRSLLRN